MQLVDYLNILRRRQGVIYLTLIIALLIIVVGITQIPAKYTATAKMRILTTKAGGTDYVEYDIDYAKRLAGTYTEIAQSEPVLSQLEQFVSPLPKITVEVISDTEILTISAEDIDPEAAQFAANKLAELLILQSREVYGSDTNILLVEEASLPETPSSTNTFIVIGLGAVVSLIVGVGLAFIFENLDTRVYAPNEMQVVTNLPLIGNIGDGNPENYLLINDHYLTEAFRRLRTNVFAPQEHAAYKTFLITSPVPQDGRSTITANLAIVAAQSNRKVLVIDADMRNPIQHKIFQVENEVGLNDVLTAGLDATQAIQSTSFQNLDVLPSGAPPLNPEALDSKEMENALKTLGEMYDAVLVDAHSSFSVTDPAVIAPKVDSVILVVRSGWDRKEVLSSTLNHLELVHARVIGIIANRTQLGSRKRLLRRS